MLRHLTAPFAGGGSVETGAHPSERREARPRRGAAFNNERRGAALENERRGALKTRVRNFVKNRGVLRGTMTGPASGVVTL